MSRPAQAAGYAEYLGLDQLLSAQRPLTEEPDELLFIIYHQVTELWFKLLLHELVSAQRSLRTDRPDDCLITLARVLRLVRQLVRDWSILETLPPERFARIRPRLGTASGLYSVQYRAIEHLLGRREGAGPPGEIGPGLFDELLRYLHRAGHPIPESDVERDWSRPRAHDPRLRELLAKVREHPAHHVERQLFARFVGIDRELARWRERHIRLVTRMINDAGGSGGTSGARYLTRRSTHSYFPELAAQRSDN